MSVNLAYCGQHFVMQTNIESCCIPETNTTLYVNYTSKKKKILKLWKKKPTEVSPYGFYNYTTWLSFSPLINAPASQSLAETILGNNLPLLRQGYTQLPTWLFFSSTPPLLAFFTSWSHFLSDIYWLQPKRLTKPVSETSVSLSLDFHDSLTGTHTSTPFVSLLMASVPSVIKVTEVLF